MWILGTEVLSEVGESRLSALDVGCGPGFVMEKLIRLMDVKGVDIDEDMVSMAVARGLDVIKGRAEDLPYEDNSFDVVYCSFLLLWLSDPKRALEEMKRVSRKWVICLAEPDYGGRLDYPKELSEIKVILAEGIAGQGGDPFVGRKLRSLLHECDLGAHIGIHPGIWDLSRLREEAETEWQWVESSAGEGRDLSGIKRAWDNALREGTIFQFNPIFYAVAMKR